MLKSKPKEYNENPDGEFVSGKLFNCEKHGEFVLNDWAIDAVNKDPSKKIKLNSLLPSDPSHLRIFYGEDLICISFKKP